MPRSADFQWPQFQCPGVAIPKPRHQRPLIHTGRALRDSPLGGLPAPAFPLDFHVPSTRLPRVDCAILRGRRRLPRNGGTAAGPLLIAKRLRCA